MVNVDYHRDLKQVQSDGQLALWLSESNQHAPFDRLEWFAMLAEHCGIAPLIATARTESGIAVLPLSSKQDEIQALSNWYTFRFRPLVSDERLLAALARDLTKSARQLSLQGVPDEDGSATSLARAFRKTGWIVFRDACDSNHILPIYGRSYEDYIASRPGPLRTTLKRKSGKVATTIFDHFDAAAWSAYEEIYAESWKEAEGSPAFLRAFAVAEGKAGRLRLGVAHAGGEAVAAQMWTVEGGTAWIHKLAHRESAKPLSPGSVLSAALFRHVIDIDKVDLVDFGTGDDPYKRDWMEIVRPRYRLDIYRPLDPRNWPRICQAIGKHGARRLAAAAKRG